MATRRYSTTARALLLLALLTMILGVPVSTAKAQSSDPAIESAVTQTVVLTVPRSGYSDPCWSNILLGLQKLGNGDNFITIQPRDYVDYNVGIGSMETTGGFITVSGTPGGCLCDLASWVAQAATNSGLRPEADSWDHADKFYNIPYADRDAIIWHVNQDSSCFTDGKRNGTCDVPVGEKDLLIYNDSMDTPVRLGWNADQTQIEFWVETSAAGESLAPTVAEQQADYPAACGKPFDLPDGQYISSGTFHTGCSTANPCEEIRGEDFWPSPGLDPTGQSTHPTSTEFPVKLLATINGNVTFASTASNGVCTSGCDGVGNAVIKLDNEFVTIYYLHADEVFVKTGDTVKIGDAIGIMGDTGQSDWTHLHYAIRDKTTGQNIQDVTGTFTCSFEIQASQSVQPSVSEETAQTIVTDVTDLPFIEDQTQPVIASEEIPQPDTIIWQSINESSSEQSDVIIIEDSISLNNQEWAVAQLVDEIPNEDGQLIVSFVDVDGDGLPSPAQEKSMQEVTHIWMMVYDIPPSDVRSLASKIDIEFEREQLRKKLEQKEAPTVQSILSAVFPYAISDPNQKTFLNLDWTSSSPLNGIQVIIRIIMISGGLLALLLISHALNNYFQAKDPDKEFVKRMKRKKKEIGSVTATEYKEQEAYRRMIQRTRVITAINIVLITGISLNFIVGVLVYTPVAYRPEAIVKVRVAQPAQPVSSQPDQPSVVAPTTTVATSTSDAVWQQIATEAGYPNWKFLETACTSHNIPRGPDGKPLSLEDGGKIFPCWWAASIISVESNDAEWNGVDPRNPGPWGYELGWYTCPDWFKLTPAEVAAGKSISGLAQACRDGLVVIANNPVVQSKWPGIKPEEIYSSGAGAVGRGQTQSFHFREGGLVYDMENMDVWSTDDVAVEAIVRHLVTRYNKSTCGASENWYYTENVEQARCAYNPGAWGDASASWYWDGMRGQADSIQKALQAHESELAGLPVIEVQPAEQVVLEAPSQNEQTTQASHVVSAGYRPTVGSGAYTVYDTLPSLALRLVKAADDGEDPKYKMWERWIFNFGRFFYRSDDVRVNLGFDTLP